MIETRLRIEDKLWAGEVKHYGSDSREWNCRCHVCGRVWVLKADFISCAQWADGTLMLTCSGDPTIPQPAHTPAEIHESWLRHGRPTA